MMPSFESRGQILQGTPQRFQESLKNRAPTEAQLSNWMHLCFNKRRGEFVNFLPILIKKGANINSIDAENVRKTIFMSACQSGNLDIVSKMIELNVDLTIKDAQNRNALFYCIENGKEEAITTIGLILDKNPELVTSECSNRKTLLIFAVQKANKDIVKVLLDRGVNVNGCLEDTQEGPLHLAVKRYRKKSSDNSNVLAIINLLMQRKVNHLAKTKNGKTVLDMCQDDEVRRLIEEFSVKDEEKKRPQVKPGTHEASREMLKKYNNVIKSQMKQSQIVMRLNDRTDDVNLQKQAAAVFEQHLAEKQKKYQEQKSKEEKRKQQQESIKNEEVARSMNWIVPPPILKYYLEQEISLFTEQIQVQNKRNKEYFDELIKNIAEVLEQPLGLTVTIYGSYATRLCLNQSDIDVVVIPKNDTKGVDLLAEVDSILKKQTFVSDSKYIRTAFIPVIKVSCSQHYKNKRIDITLQDANHNGLNCVNIIRKYMNYYKELRPLAFVLKTFIYSSNLYDTYQGGLSSYGLILMIVALLQGEYEAKRADEKLMVSELLIKFLRLFGNNFDYVNKYIYVPTPQSMADPNVKKGLYVVTDPMYRMVDVSPKLVILDPLNDKNNVGRSTHQIKQIQTAFSVAYTSIQANYSCRSSTCPYRRRIEAVQLPKELIDGKVPRPCCILKRMFECYKKFT